MKALWITLAACAAMAAGVWLAWAMGLRLGGDVARDVPPELAALHAHFARHGIGTSISLVRREHADVRYRAMFIRHDAARRTFYVIWCDTPEVVQLRATVLRALAIPAVLVANGPLLLYLPHWPEQGPDTEQLAQVFRSLDAGGIRPAGS